MNGKLLKAMQLLTSLLMLMTTAFTYPAEVSAPTNNIQVMSTEPVRPSTAKDDLPFKRLFTTPRQRQILDDWRARGGLKQSQVSGNDENTTNIPVEQTIDLGQPVKLSGILLRADGKNAVWLNGALEKPTEENTAHTIRGSGLQSATVKVPLRDGESGAILKPGQVWVPESKRVEEAYQIAPPKPAADVNLQTPSNESKASSSASAATSSAAQSSANASEMAPNVEPKASTKSK